MEFPTGGQWSLINDLCQTLIHTIYLWQAFYRTRILKPILEARNWGLEFQVGTEWWPELKKMANILLKE